MKNLFTKSVIATLITGSLALTSASVSAVEKGDWLVRFGAVNVSPNDSSTDYQVLARRLLLVLMVTLRCLLTSAI